jgi:GntR family transcriptional repressor for pyruvate dehydrogenase complex
MRFDVSPRQKGELMADAMSDTRVPKASDVLANLLKVKILSEGLQPGERLPPEAELIEQYRFSRGTVREALRMLEIDGIVTVRRGPRGGIEVSSPDVSRVTRSLAVLFAFDGTPVRDLLEFRLVIEPGAASMAARHATKEQCERLLASTMEAADSVPHSVDFHRLLGDSTNNGFMSTMMTSMNQVLEWQTTSQELTATEQHETTSAHRSIAEAVSKGDEAKAARAMRTHLTEFMALLDRQGRLDLPVVPRPNANGQGLGAARY